MAIYLTTARNSRPFKIGAAQIEFWPNKVILTFTCCWSNGYVRNTRRGGKNSHTTINIALVLVAYRDEYFVRMLKMLFVSLCSLGRNHNRKYLLNCFFPKTTCTYRFQTRQQENPHRKRCLFSCHPTTLMLGSISYPLTHAFFLNPLSIYIVCCLGQ